MPIDERLMPLLRSDPDADPTEQLNAATVRADDLAVLELQTPGPSLYAVEDMSLGAVSLRLYRPEPGPLPTLIYFHGGGFVIGGEGYAQPLRALAATTQALVAVPHIRLAPEHPFPAAIDDAIASAERIASLASDLAGQSQPLGIVGDSFGGNLAAVTTRALTRQGVPLDFQVLIYPMLDATASSRSYLDLANGYGFTREKSLWYFNQYLPACADRRDPRISPLFEPDLSGLPATLVITAEYDPLRDGGELYADKLRQAGCEATVHRYDGMIHGFFQLTSVVDNAHRVQDEIAQWLRLHSRPNDSRPDQPPAARADIKS